MGNWEVDEMKRRVKKGIEEKCVEDNLGFLRFPGRHAVKPQAGAAKSLRAGGAEGRPGPQVGLNLGAN